ncbi:MAG: helix-turn-helix domain-containing protein [Rhodoferax sp.]
MKMPNLATVLKEEILRLARKEVRSEILPLRKAAAQSRTDINALKKRVTTLEKQVASLSKTSTKATEKAELASEPENIRFSSKGFATLRRRLGLSAAEMAFLLATSDQSVYKWERGARPRAQQLPKIAALRKLSKSQVTELLKSLQK